MVFLHKFRDWNQQNESEDAMFGIGKRIYYKVAALCIFVAECKQKETLSSRTMSVTAQSSPCTAHLI
jgi:hypothetical protein